MFMLSVKLIPFSRQPHFFHVVLATLLLATVVVAMLGWLNRLNEAFVEIEASLTHERLSFEFKKRDASAPKTSFLSRLPAQQQIDEVVKALVSHAEKSRVTTASLTLTPLRSNRQEYPRFEISVNASGDYTDIKKWLAHLLGRYPSLAIQSLSSQSSNGLDVRVNSQLVLVLYARD